MTRVLLLGMTTSLDEVPRGVGARRDEELDALRLLAGGRPPLSEPEVCEENESERERVATGLEE